MQIEVLGERYQLQEPIGRGGMATIYRGRDLRMDRTVAIKVLRDIYSTDPKFVKRFEREAKAASALQHPNIVQVFDYGQTDGNYYIVMELVEGTDLRRYLRPRGILDVEKTIIIAHDVALGLVMYEMLTGHTPFDGDTPVAVAMQHIQDIPTPPSQFNPNIPPVLEDIILRCLEKVPEMRYRDGSQLARALESLGDAEFAET